jgi:CBS domain-containing protein
MAAGRHACLTPRQILDVRRFSGHGSPRRCNVSLKVSIILERKGPEVVTIRPDAMLLAAADALHKHRIGALVVSADGKTPEGMVSERDLVRELARLGTGAVKRSVGEIMSTTVTTCAPDTTIDSLMALMTEQRIRHIPVLADGALCGIVSIGDIVKNRLDELEVEKQSLEEYVTGGA